MTPIITELIEHDDLTAVRFVTDLRPVCQNKETKQNTSCDAAVGSKGPPRAFAATLLTGFCENE